MFNIIHPMMILPNSNKVYLATDGCTERMGPGWMDKRNFLVTLLDPFDVVGLLKKKDKAAVKFWEREEDFPIVPREEGGGGGRCRNTKGIAPPPPPPPPPPQSV